MKINYKNIKTFKDIKKFDYSSNNDLGLIKNNKAIILDNTFDKIPIDLPKKSASMFFFKNDFYVSDSELFVTNIYINIFKQKKVLKCLISIPTTKSKRSYLDYIFPIVYENKNTYNGKFNTLNCILEKKYELYLGLNGIYQVLNDNLFLSQNKEKIGVFNFNNTCIWEKSYKELFAEYDPIGAGTTNILKVGNKLYVELDKTYCINLNTGKVEHIYEHKFTNSENEFLYGLQFLSMTEFQLAILNTTTNQIKLIDVSDEFNKLNVYPDNRIVIKEGLVYFSQNMGDNIAKIGIFCPKTEKILWKYDFEKQNGMIGTLKVQGNRIYAHTQDKTLHIFEKTQNETT